jgi:hypothetical protein
MSKDELYPEITVKLVGKEGNAFGIIGSVTKAMKAMKVPPEKIEAFREECMAGDYNHLLRTCMKWVNVV